MKNAFLITALAAVLLVGCNEQEETSGSSGLFQSTGTEELLKMVECASIARIGEQVYQLAALGRAPERIREIALSEFTDEDGRMYKILQSTVNMTIEEAMRAAEDPSEIYSQLSSQSLLWSAEILKLCNSDQL